MYAGLRLLHLSSPVVLCSSLNGPDNGAINCSLGDDETLFYEDICSFTCNTGYELTGSDTRTCQSDGSWSDSDVVCRRSIGFLVCLLLVKNRVYN